MPTFKDIEYDLSVAEKFWAWSVELPDGSKHAGNSVSKSLAAYRAISVIENYKKKSKQSDPLSRAVRWANSAGLRAPR